MGTPEIIAPPQMMGYINLVKSDAVIVALVKNSTQVFELLARVPAEKYDFAYAANKWTVKQILQHMIDSERVFALRTLWFSRDPGSSLPGFDEKGWAVNAPVALRSWEAMVGEFKTVRESTRYLFDSLPPEAYGDPGVADNQMTNTMACAYVCAGHVRHHINVLDERYGII